MFHMIVFYTFMQTQGGFLWVYVTLLRAKKFPKFQIGMDVAWKTPLKEGTSYY